MSRAIGKSAFRFCLGFRNPYFWFRPSGGKGVSGLEAERLVLPSPLLCTLAFVHPLSSSCMPVQNGQRLRNVVFTINNPRRGENDEYVEPEYDADRMRYLGYALERGANGTVHFQGYAEFYTPTTLQSIKVFLGDTRAHIEPRRGTAQQARDYFAVDSDKSGETLQPAKEFGALSRQGKRSDLDAVVDAVRVSLMCCRLCGVHGSHVCAPSSSYGRILACLSPK